MEININNKVFLGKYDENGKIIITLNNNEDVQYFQQWLSQKKGYYVET